LIISRVFIFLILIYQAVLSPYLGSNCRHSPTCSQYAIEAFKEWGFLKGLFLGIKRIVQCRPGGTSGYDPVPKNDNKIKR